MEEVLANMSGSTVVSIESFMECVLTALALGLALSTIYSFRNRHTQSLSVTLALLPSIVCVVITMVNGNLGAGVAVAGTFSLVRFRSAPGSARDICFVFLAMAIGLVCGMGYLWLALLVTLVIGGAYLVLQLTGFNGLSKGSGHALRVWVPQDFDYTSSFDDLFARYTTYHELVSVKSTGAGSLYKLVYNIGIRNDADGKVVMDEIRALNGNLEVAITHQVVNSDEL